MRVERWRGRKRVDRKWKIEEGEKEWKDGDKGKGVLEFFGIALVVS